MSRFIIKRRDLTSDDLIVECDGLTIGSALGNDLLLNHPTVSRTHAGIREIDGQFWITNLSQSNGTLVNGALIESVQLQADDTIQFGVFVGRLVFGNADELILEIDRQIDALAAGDRATQLLGDPNAAAAQGKTTMLNPAMLRQGTQQLPGGQPTTQLDQPGGTQKLPTMRLQRGMTGALTSILALPEEQQKRFRQAIDAFWDRRKAAETGGQKLADKSPLRPTEPDPEWAKFNLHLGKKQFNWLPSTDLVRPWPRGYLYVFGAICIVASLLFAIVWEDAYVPGPTSSPHALSAADLAQQSPQVAARLKDKLVANRLAENNCNACHAPTASVQAQCVTCHQTAHFVPDATKEVLTSTHGGTAKNRSGLTSEIAKTHEKAGVTCIDCHTEHKGPDFRLSAVSRRMCIDCHQNNPTHPKAKYLTDKSISLDGKETVAVKKGEPLRIPHAGVKLPGKDGKWDETWSPRNTAWGIEQSSNGKLGAREKFHLVHTLAAANFRIDQKAMGCFGCHSAGFDTEVNARKIDLNKCTACHGVGFGQDTKTNEQLETVSRQFDIGCNSCHPQHIESPRLMATLRPYGTSERPFQIADNSTAMVVSQNVFRGGKDWQWTSFASRFGGMSAKGWGIFFFGCLLTVPGFLVFDTFRKRRLQSLLKGREIDFAHRIKKFADTRYADRWESDTQKARAKESSQARFVPHPVINYETCIGCHACILACPQDVLGFDEQEHHAIVVNYEQCMEDTGCQQACPTVPQSCVVINTKKEIKEAPKPIRKGEKEGFETEHVEGVYLVGDVSGVPLIRNAIREGRTTIDKIVEKLSQEGRKPGADYDVAIIGIGPGGISATARAAEQGLTYVAIEQGRRYSTIADKYPKGKYVAFNPYNPNDPPLAPIKLDGAGNLKETMLAWWDETVERLNVKINEFETCKEIAQENGIFVVKTSKQPNGYRVRKVVLALGTSGEPRKLGVPGEKEATDRGQVLFRLDDPSKFKGKNLIIVGAGNSAVEAAVDLTGKRQEDGTVIFPTEGANSVTLVIRSDFPKDLTLENKMWAYYCIDRGKIKAYFGAGIKEIKPTGEVVLMKIRGEEEIATVPNDHVFAMIGSIAPKDFLQKIGIKYSGDKK